MEHYKKGKLEPNDFIEANDMNFAEGCIVKYITRYKFKGTPVEDLKKARDYIDRLIRANTEVEAIKND
jgi:hypothetical protein